LPSGETHAIEPGRSVRISTGLELDLGTVRAHIE
jgi:hypothetical protein